MVKSNYLLLIICLFAISALSACADINNYANKAPWVNKQSGNDSQQVYAPVSTPMVMQNNGFANLPPVKVAILLPLSGPQAKIGEAMLQSAQLALFDIGYENFQLIFQMEVFLQ